MLVELQDIVEHKRSEVASRQAALPLEYIKKAAQGLNGNRFEKALQGYTLYGNLQNMPRLILEIKPASPSAGVLTDTLVLPNVLESYNSYASAISVLTDQKFFSGSLALLTDVVNNTSHPVLCKDFILEPYQIYEARLAGAHAVLLIVKILSDDRLLELHNLAHELGMTSVVEVQNEAELERAIRIEPSVILINNRNLETFDISLDTTCQIAPLVPNGIIRISASGIESRSNIDELLPYCSCFLIGSVLMKTPPDLLRQKLKELAGR